MSIYENIELKATEESGTPERNTLNSENLLYVTLRVARAINHRIAVALQQDRDFVKKKDNTPVTEIDKECEDIAREMYEDAFNNSISVVGEERGGEFDNDGYCVAIDPIDGTWAFIGDTGQFSTSIGIYKKGKPYLGLVSNPTASELTYAIDNESPRLLREPRWGSDRSWHTLPQTTDQKSILVNMQSRKTDADILTKLSDAWEAGALNQVRCSGGSPALSLAEVAKGSNSYVSHWAKASSPHDLGAGIKIVENAGGSVVNIDGEPITPIGHAGIFVASLRNNHQEVIRDLLR